MSSTCSRISVAMLLASQPQDRFGRCNSSKLTTAGALFCNTDSRGSPCTVTSAHSTRNKDLPTCSSAARPAPVQALLPLSPGNEQEKHSGRKCCGSPTSFVVNGLSWSSRRETRRGRPKSRAVWRELATTAPELNLRLQILVRLISAGECSFLPTPVSRDFRSPGKPSHRRLTESRGQPLPEILGCRIHPELCEWLMGLPVGWTEMLPSRRLEIPTHPSWPKRSAARSSKRTSK